MANVKAAMEYAASLDREAMEKRLSESDLKAPTLIDVVAKHEQEIQELKRLVTPRMEFNPEKPTMGMEYAANFEKAEKLLEKKECYDSPGPAYKHVVYPPDPPKEWVGLTDEEVLLIYRDQSNQDFQMRLDPFKLYAAIEAKLKDKNNGND